MKFFYLGVFILSIYFASATITYYDGDNSFPDTPENSSLLYNLSVSSSVLGYTNEIVKLEILLPSDLSFVATGNGSSANFSSFLFASSKLSWSGAILISNDTREYFWFYALSSNDSGDYFVNVKSYNSSGVFEQVDIPITILDTDSPEVTIHSPEGKTYDLEFILINVSINERGNCYYSTDGGLQNSSLKSYGGKNFAENVSFEDGKVDLDVFCFDEDSNLGIASVGFKTNYSTVPTNNQTIDNIPVQNQSNISTQQLPQDILVSTQPNISSQSNAPQNASSSENTSTKSSDDLIKWIVVIMMVIFGIILLFIAWSKSRQEGYKGV